MKELRRAVEVSKSASLRRVSGGAAHSDEAADRKLINTMVKPEARTGRAAGGSTKKGSHKKSKPSVSVNVIAPQGQGRPVPVPVPVSGGATAAPGPIPSRALVPPPAGPMPMRGMPVPPPSGPVGPLNSKNGGKIKKRAAGGSVKLTGGENGVGRIEKAELQRAKGGK